MHVVLNMQTLTLTFQEILGSTVQICSEPFHFSTLLLLQPGPRLHHHTLVNAGPSSLCPLIPPVSPTVYAQHNSQIVPWVTSRQSFAQHLPVAPISFKADALALTMANMALQDLHLSLHLPYSPCLLQTHCPSCWSLNRPGQRTSTLTLPSAWNHLPPDIHKIHSITSFKSFF